LLGFFAGRTQQHDGIQAIQGFAFKLFEGLWTANIVVTAMVVDVVGDVVGDVIDVVGVVVVGVVVVVVGKSNNAARQDTARARGNNGIIAGILTITAVVPTDDR
jgi:hypothetical protein